MTKQMKLWLLSCPMRLRRRVCTLYLILLTVLSLLPAYLFPPSVTQISGIDKAMHVAMYGLLAAMLRWAAGQGPLRPAARWLPLAAAGYGLLMECLQLLLSGGTRMFGWDDALANLVGAVLFWVVADWFFDRRQA